MRIGKLRGGGRLRAHAAPASVLVVGLAITAVLSWLAYVSNDRNESRLLRAQVRQTGALLQAVVPSVQTPLASAAEIAAAGGGRFATYLSSSVGPNKAFVGAELWQVTAGRPQVVSTVGEPTKLPASGRAGVASSTMQHPGLAVFGPIGTDRIGYAYASSDGPPSYVVYAEGILPPRRRAAIQKNSPFANLRFALYLGGQARPDKLLETNVGHLPLDGRTASTAVPFGNATLTLVAGSSTTLGGSISSSLWWIIAVAGAALTAAGAVAAERLVAREAAAERLTAEVRTLLGEQRTIAEALQRALLPNRLPEVPAMTITARYLPGTDGVEIGGDWYDVVPLDTSRFFFVVGDVSGRGLGAGSVMASLLFAIRGFVSEGHPPDRVLDALSRLLDVRRDKHFATVLCGVVDVTGHTITIANAGHLPPLLVSTDRTEFMALPTGPPIGVAHPDGYAATVVPVPDDATLLAFTDGLVERRGETLDDGLRRLMDAASSSTGSGEALVEDVMNALVPDGSDDDTALLGLAWHR